MFRLLFCFVFVAAPIMLCSLGCSAEQAKFELPPESSQTQTDSPGPNVILSPAPNGGTATMSTLPSGSAAQPAGGVSAPGPAGRGPQSPTQVGPQSPASAEPV